MEKIKDAYETWKMVLYVQVLCTRTVKHWKAILSVVEN